MITSSIPLRIKSVTFPPHELMKLSLDKHLSWKTCFLLVFASAKKVSEFHWLSYGVHC